MRYFMEGLALFLLLALTGVDVKAAAADEDNFTEATAWVEEWEMEMKKPHDCNGVNKLFDTFVRKAKETIGAAPSRDDLFRIQDSIFSAENMMHGNMPCLGKQSTRLLSLEQSVAVELGKQ